MLGIIIIYENEIFYKRYDKIELQNERKHFVELLLRIPTSFRYDIYEFTK